MSVVVVVDVDDVFHSSSGLRWPVSVAVVVVDVDDVFHSSSGLRWPVSIGLNKNLFKTK